LVYIQRYTPRYCPQFRYRYVPQYMARYMPRFRKLFQNRWDALMETRRQQRGAYTPEEWKMYLANIQKRRRVKK